eukprot:10751481-Alexandrium_andersonii.AAC.1
MMPANALMCGSISPPLAAGGGARNTYVVSRCCRCTPGPKGEHQAARPWGAVRRSHRCYRLGT